MVTQEELVSSPEGVSCYEHTLLQMPTGEDIRVQFIVIQGSQPGPTFLITSNIHGNEVTGLVVVHRIVEHAKESLSQLKGRIVCIPSLNPTGLWLQTRQPMFDAQTDPNRCWPNCKPENVPAIHKPEETDRWAIMQNRVTDKKGKQQKAFQTLFELIRDGVRPDYHVDLHTFSTLSIPFIFIDPVFYHGVDQEAREGAIRLYNNTIDFSNAFGVTLIRERLASVYIKENLHRSTSGAFLHLLQIPSVTFEMGPMLACPYATGCTQAVMNALKKCGNFSGPMEAIDQFPVVTYAFPHRMLSYPMSSSSGIIDWKLNPGSRFKEGEVLGIVRDMFANQVAVLKAEMDGVLIGCKDGIMVYEDDVLAAVAVAEENDEPQVLSWSELPLHWFI